MKAELRRCAHALLRRKILRDPRRLWRALCVAWCAWCLAPLAQALSCEGERHIRLTRPVEVSTQDLADFRAMAPLRMLSADAPPMARYDSERGTYTGVGVDVWCFIANRLGLHYELISGQEQTVAQKILQVQEGKADVFMPLSLQSERARRGLFTLPFYESYYAVIARKGWRQPVRGLADLAQYRVGVVHGVALEPQLKQVVPPHQLVSFDENSSAGMFQALRDGSIDLAVFNKSIFAEKRYQHEYFDLEDILTLYSSPRGYRFYFSPSPQHERLVAAFDRYLVAMDVSESVAAHEFGERQFLERYVKHRGQRIFLQVASVAALVVALVLYLALRRYRKLVRLLEGSNRQIRQQQQALQAANLELERQSHTDGLTGLANRRELDQALRREQARQKRTGTPLSLLMVDVDHFKCVNDHYGHAMGDDYLRAIARVLRATVARPTDLVARYGGEEFVCLLPDTAAADAFAVAERIRRGVADLGLPNALAAVPHLTLSIGIATTSGTNAKAPQLLAQADAQLYAAKHAGRDRVHAVVL
ncbi:MAG: GGDEF domain-containing protein [Proteobacteria bacterium]|nr:GGDEF domain-containing protein [Pseudomonadota bacterium]